jgi:hypothetical protein
MSKETEEIQEVEDKSIEKLLVDHATLQSKVDIKEREFKDAKKELQTLDEAILTRFEEEGLTSCKVSGLGSFIAGGQEYYSLLKENREAGMEAFREHFPTMIQETINSSSLSAFMREAKKTGQDLPEEITKSVTSYEKKWISWRRS